MKQGPWYVYKAGWLALYAIAAAIVLLALITTWASGGIAIPGLLGVLFFVMIWRQLQLKGQRTRD